MNVRAVLAGRRVFVGSCSLSDKAGESSQVMVEIVGDGSARRELTKYVLTLWGRGIKQESRPLAYVAAIRSTVPRRMTGKQAGNR